jgi:hypothetical protein
VTVKTLTVVLVSVCVNVSPAEHLRLALFRRQCDSAFPWCRARQRQLAVDQVDGQWRQLPIFQNGNELPGDNVVANDVERLNHNAQASAAASHADLTFIRVERSRYCDMTLLVALPQM